MILIRPMLIDDAALYGSSIAEDDYTAWAIGTTYALGDRVRVVGSNIHEVYESLIAGNVGNTPALTPTYWLKVGATNRWAMFDQSITSQASFMSSFYVQLQTSNRIDSVAAFNVDSPFVYVSMTDSVDGLVYSKTVSMIDDSGIGDWHAYFYEPIARKKDFILTDLPPYYQSLITVSFIDPGNIVSCGALIIGLKKDIGGTQYGAKLSIQDYSVKTRDAFGNYSILERSFNKQASFSLLVDAGNVDSLQQLLASYRSIPVVYSGSDQYSSSTIYGFYKDFGITIAYPTKSVCNIDIEGLT